MRETITMKDNGHFLWHQGSDEYIATGYQATNINKYVMKSNELFIKNRTSLLGITYIDEILLGKEKPFINVEEKLKNLEERITNIEEKHTVSSYCKDVVTGFILDAQARCNYEDGQFIIKEQGYVDATTEIRNKDNTKQYNLQETEIYYEDVDKTIIEFQLFNGTELDGPDDWGVYYNDEFQGTVIVEHKVNNDYDDKYLTQKQMLFLMEARIQELEKKLSASQNN